MAPATPLDFYTGVGRMKKIPTTVATQSSPATRVERDTMGELAVPATAYYGVQTARAIENFPISSLRFPRAMIRAMGMIKRAAATVNQSLGLLDKKPADAINQAATEVVEGKLDAEFPVDIFQTGSGTSTNMNCNEVISNRATELLGGARGSKLVHPNDHVNLGQSSNDVIPTAIHIAAGEMMQQQLIPALTRLHKALDRKAKEFDKIVKIGRTHLQDATPVRLGQEFGGYARQIELGIQRVTRAQAALSEVALGGTAVGTGLNCHPKFSAKVLAIISKETGCTFKEAKNHFEAQSTQDSLGRSERGVEDHRCEPHEDRQRHSLARLRPALWARGDQSAGDTTRLVHHAGQSKPGHCRIGDDGLRSGDRKRCDGHSGRAGG